MNRPDALPPEFTDSEPWTLRERRGRFDRLAGCMATLYQLPADHALDPRKKAEQPPAC